LAAIGTYSSETVLILKERPLGRVSKDELVKERALRDGGFAAFSG
jgi:hypothetical protein